MANCLQPALTFAAQLVDFAVQTSNNVRRLVDRSAELGSLALPSANAVALSGPSAYLGVDLLTQLALGTRWNCLHDEFHAACLAHPVLLGAVLSEVAPLPVATGEAVLVKEAHVSRVKSWDLCCSQAVSVVSALLG
jgi:hypothetical protein